jgi:prepilin-type N-terminal cleavage/methylation domain-containing protein
VFFEQPARKLEAQLNGFTMWIRQKRGWRRGERGFTLIEILVVVAMLAVLAAIVILNLSAFVGRGKAAACETDLASVQTAVDAYYNENGAYPWSGASTTFPGIVPTFLHTAPTTTGAVTIDSSGNAAAADC